MEKKNKYESEENNLLERDDKLYKTNIDKIKINYLYVNENNEIYNVKSCEETLQNSKLSKERILYLIKNYQYNLREKHKLTDILQYNISINEDEIKDLIMDKNDRNYLVSIKIIDDIKFNDTVKILEKENSIIFILTKINKIQSTTRRVNINYKNKTIRKQ